jgi:hypothetical protein
MDEIISEVRERSVYVSEELPSYLHPQSAMILDSNDNLTAQKLLDNTGSNHGRYGIILTKMNLEQLLQGNKMLVYGQGEYSFFVFVEDNP